MLSGETDAVKAAEKVLAMGPKSAGGKTWRVRRDGVL